MADYQTGTSTGPTDLLSKLRTFLETDQGWTVNDYSSDGTGYRLHVQKTPSSGEMVLYFNFRSAVNERGLGSGTGITEDNYDLAGSGEVTGIIVNGSTGYNGSNDWHDQPGRPDSPDYSTGLSGGMCMTGMSTSAIPAYYFFAVGDSVHIVVETTSGKFQFMSFGLLVKQGTYTGGAYFSASYATRQPNADWKDGSADNYGPYYFSFCYSSRNRGYVYVDVDSVADWRHSHTTLKEIMWGCPASQRGNPSYTQLGINSFFWSKGPNFYNNISSGCPIYTLLKRGDGNYSLLGWPEGVRSLNASLYSAGQEVTYGSETWKIFEELSFEDNTEILNENLGFSYLKVT